MHPTHSAVCSDELLTHYCTTFRAQNQARSIFYEFLKKRKVGLSVLWPAFVPALPIRVATRSPDVL